MKHGSRAGSKEERGLSLLLEGSVAYLGFQKGGQMFAGH